MPDHDFDLFTELEGKTFYTVQGVEILIHKVSMIYNRNAYITTVHVIFVPNNLIEEEYWNYKTFNYFDFSVVPINLRVNQDIVGLIDSFNNLPKKYVEFARYNSSWFKANKEYLTGVPI